MWYSNMVKRFVTEFSAGQCYDVITTHEISNCRRFVLMCVASLCFIVSLCFRFRFKS